MKYKLMIYYSISFTLACVIIFFINIDFIRNNVYKEGSWQNYDSVDIISEFNDYIYLSNDNKIEVNDNGIKFLESNDIGLQILNENNKEIFQYNKPDIAQSYYSNLSLIDMYKNKATTLYLGEKKLNDNNYTYLLFLKPTKIKRVTYDYDIDIIGGIYKFPLLISINIISLLIISFLYTIAITKSMNKVIKRIVDLSNNNYSIEKASKGIYYDIELCLNQLSDRLSSSDNERNKLENMREEWISNISHDIKTPLTSIIGNAEILGDVEYNINDEARLKCCNTIINKSEYIKSLVEDLNLSARLSCNTLVLNKKKVNIVSFIRHILIDIINDEKYDDSNISFNYSDEDITLELDENLMKRVFINLIINAFVHNENDVEIKININKLDNKVYLSIEDNGKGIAKNELNHIFKRYYRGTNTSKKVEGSGLGMAIAHDIVKAHGADIKATSKLGYGLRIDIKFEKSS